MCEIDRFRSDSWLLDDTARAIAAVWSGEMVSFVIDDRLPCYQAARREAVRR